MSWRRHWLGTSVGVGEAGMTVSLTLLADPVWDQDKANVLGLHHGAFNIGVTNVGDKLPETTTWFRIDGPHRRLGYAWWEPFPLDEDPPRMPLEIQMALEKTRQGHGSDALDLLQQEATARQHRAFVGRVMCTHPKPDEIKSWLLKHGFVERQEAGDDGVLVYWWKPIP